MTGVGMINQAPDRELLGREIDHIVTRQMLELRQLIGGLSDPLPRADKPATTMCRLCDREHVTFALYFQRYRDELSVITEIRICFGCITRLLAEAWSPVPSLPAYAGVTRGAP